MASNESFKQAIKAYLDKRAEEDSLFAPNMRMRRKVLMNAVVISWVRPGSVVTP